MTAHALSDAADERDEAAATAAFQLRCFIVAWGLAALFHIEPVLLAWREPVLAVRLTGALVIVAALAACWAPSMRTLVGLAVAQLLDVAALMPAVPNHWLLAGCVNLALLLACLRARRPENLLARARPPILVAVAIFYLWTGIWKLNADFVRPETSCAIVSWRRVLEVFPWLPDGIGVRRTLIALTLVMELAGPLFLLVPATRGLAVAAFIGFHIVLGLDTIKVYLNFSSVMFALMTLCLPSAAAARLRALLPASVARLPRLIVVAYVALATAGIAAGADSPLYMIGRWSMWLAYAIALFVLIGLAVVGAGVERYAPAAVERSGIVWIVPVLVALNGAAPLVGLKTRTSWQMYSNVRLEPSASNHYLFSRSWDALGAMRDLVTVIEGGGPTFRDVAGTDLALPWLEFRRRLAAEPNARITWERGGRRTTTTRVADDPELSRPLPFLVRTFVIFRPLGPDAGTRCDW